MLSNNDRQTRELLSSDRPEDTSNRIFSDAYPKPIKRDWVLLLGHFAVALCGLLVLPFRPGVGIVAIAWGGSCAFLFAFIIVKKAFFNRSALLRVKIVGGVPIKPSRVFLLVAAVWLIALGGVLIILGWSFGPVFIGASAAVAAIGCYIVIGLSVGWLPNRYLQFDPVGVTFGYLRWSYTVQWDNIAGIAASTLNSNPVVLIYVREPHIVNVYPLARKLEVFKHFNRNCLSAGAPVVLSPVPYGMDIRLLMTALQRYVAKRSSRAELSQQLLDENVTVQDA